MGLVVLNATLCFLLLNMERCDLIIMNKWNFIHKVLIICILPAWAWAAPEDTVREQQFINQQQRQQALENQLAPPSPDIHLSAEEINTDDGLFPVEEPCFAISQIILQGADALPHWLPLQRQANKAIGRCLGGKGINLLMAKLQNILIDRGYITSRILAPQQDLKSGVLRLVVMPGYIREARLTEDSDNYLWLASAFPATDGKLLDLRDIEQGLENLQRLPTVQASMEIIPGDTPGQSDIVINRQQERFWRVDASLDDSGSNATGRYQGNLTLSLDNPLALSDLFYLSGSHNLDGNGGKSSKNLTGHYSIPLGYWQLGLTASQYDYMQTVAGANGDYQYSGKSKNVDFQMSRVLHRSGSQKTTLSADVLAREQRNFINDTEIGRSAAADGGLEAWSAASPLPGQRHSRCRSELSARYPLVWRSARAGRAMGGSNRPQQNPAIQCSAQFAFCPGRAKFSLYQSLSAADEQHAADFAGYVFHRQPLDGSRL